MAAAIMSNTYGMLSTLLVRWRRLTRKGVEANTHGLQLWNLWNDILEEINEVLAAE